MLSVLEFLEFLKDMKIVSEKSKNKIMNGGSDSQILEQKEERSQNFAGVEVPEKECDTKSIAGKSDQRVEYPSSKSKTKEGSKDILIKNLPFTLNKDDFAVFLTSIRIRPKKFVMIRDDDGKFTGMIVIKFQQIEDAILSFGHFQGIQLGGRTMVAEFRKRSSRNKKKTGKVKTALNCDEINSINHHNPSAEKYPHSSIHNSRADHLEKGIICTRQPHAPDGTNGFSKPYQDSRSQRFSFFSTPIPSSVSKN